MESIKLDYGPDAEGHAFRRTGSPTIIEYVGGPRDLEREGVYGHDPVAVIVVRDAEGAAGVYRRSARCADDNILRYVWQRD